ncbi:hypothetical protein ACHAXA_005256 [Cyclostephanos tholiformis]|uniref:Uncharacterized protein n=1 Tax=Cyclostephanos tholiformis TaxID=382380 RepID=A0ABD3RBV3_9STRA
MRLHRFGVMQMNTSSLFGSFSGVDSSFVPSLDDGAPSKGPLHPLVFEVSKLKNVTLAHGTFFFGPHSQEADIIVSSDHIKPSLNDAQKELLDDEIINVEKERERCARYNLNLVNETHPIRRRLFAGWLISDDSMEVLNAVSTESYNVFHTVSYVEAFRAHNLNPRNMRYYHPPPGGGSTGEDIDNNNLNELLQLFGPNTKVSVDYYNTSMAEQYESRSQPFHGELFMDYVQREGNTHRWAMNGMRHDDIGIIGDADETFTRDFLRAMQVCDFPEFRMGQDCNMAQVKASTLVFESSPECLTKGRRWYHPDAILGECVDNVGDRSYHPPAPREYFRDENDTMNDQHGLRRGHQLDAPSPGEGYPLWHGTDIRMLSRGNQYVTRDDSATAYHFHNYFVSAEEIHLKYATYGHAKGDVAYNMPIWALSDDLKLGVGCANENGGDSTLTFNGTGSAVLPVYYINRVNRDKRHSQWQKIVRGEEEYWRKRIDDMQDLENEGKHCWLACGERAGECPFYCGRKGLCCASASWDMNNRAPECGDNLGCDDGQCCVAAPQ